eukprot:2869637-Rhodomonas_salina.2
MAIRIWDSQSAGGCGGGAPPVSRAPRCHTLSAYAPDTLCTYVTDMRPGAIRHGLPQLVEPTKPNTRSVVAWYA